MTSLNGLLTLFLTTSVNAATLCNADEVVYFSCKLEDQKIVSICARDNNQPNKGYVQWRLGSEHKKDLIPVDIQAPEQLIQVNNYSENIYNFISFTLHHNEKLYSAYMGDYGEEHWMEGITIGKRQLSCDTPVISDYSTGKYDQSLTKGNVALSDYPFNQIVDAALKTEIK